MTVNAYQRNVLFLARLIAMALLSTASMSLAGQSLAPGVGRYNRSTRKPKEQTAPAATLTESGHAAQAIEFWIPAKPENGSSFVTTPPTTDASAVFKVTPLPAFYVDAAGASATETLTITNTSKDSYTLDSFAASVDVGFTVPENLTAVIPAGGTYQVPVTYKPTNWGDFKGWVTFSAKADGTGPAGKMTVPLQSTTKPLSFTSPGIFAALPGKTSLTQHIKLNNNSGDAYHIDRVEIKGRTSSGFLFTGVSAGTSLAANGTLDIPVTYSPRNPEKPSNDNPDEAILYVYASKAGGTSGDQSASIPLTGVRGVGLEKLLEPFTLAPNQASSFQILRIKSSKGDYTFSGAELSGDNAGDFSVSDCNDNAIPLTPNRAFHITKSRSCSIVVTYNPVAASADTASAKGGGKATLKLTVKKEDREIPFAMDLVENGAAKSVCDEPQAHIRHNVFPLMGAGATSDTVNCWYNSTKFYSLLSQMRYLYSPGGSANTVGTDLVALHFLGGVQIALAGAGSTIGCDSTTTGNNSSCKNTSGSNQPANQGVQRLRAFDTTSNSATAATAPSLQQDIQTLIKGGDFALKASWPWYQYKGHGVQILSTIEPRAGFTVDGLSAQATATNVTEVNENISSESYIQVDALAPADGGDSPGSVFFDYRVGGEFVGQDFAKVAKLSSNKFLLQTFAAGVVFNGSVRLSAQRYVGPPQDFLDSTGKRVNYWRNWQLQVQITPTNISK